MLHTPITTKERAERRTEDDGMVKIVAKTIMNQSTSCLLIMHFILN